MNAPTQSTQSPIEFLLQPLTPEERQEFEQLTQHLAEFSSNPDQMPEKSIGMLLNRASPAVKQTFALLSEMFETPRLMPFQSKMSESDYANSMGLDPAQATAVKANLDREYVENALQRRMGTQQPDNSPPTRREQISSILEQFKE